MSPKVKFASLIWWVCLLVAITFMSLGWGSGTTKTKAPKEFNVWVVWDDTAWFSKIITWFKSKFSQYNGTQIKFTKFTSYSDYEKILLNVMTEGNPPDIFVINNSSMTEEWDWLLESKIIWLPKNVVDVDKFQKDFNKVFDELIIQSEEKNEDWKKIKVDYLKWVPMWFEALGVFYNFRKVRNIPSTWAELDKSIETDASEWYSTIWIWLWSKYIIWASDILSLFFVQNWVTSYKKLSDDASSNYLKAYRSYYKDQNNRFDAFRQDLDQLNQTNVDLFVRWKVGLLIGYPSLIKDILEWIKRTQWDADVWPKTLRTSPIFQYVSDTTDKWDKKEDKQEKLNLINYNFFALSKYTTNKQLWMDFLSYLATKDAQEKYISSFPYYLPAMRLLEEWRVDQTLEDWYDRAKYRDFISNEVTLKTFEKWIKSEYDNYFWNALSNDASSDSDIIKKWFQIIECNVNHLIKSTDFEKRCD